VVDNTQITKWLNKGIITKIQAKKMLEDIPEKSRFLSSVTLIGSILIFIGFAWLIAKNWHQISSTFKVLILVITTLSTLSFGVILREKNHRAVGRSLILLGSSFYVLSLFLISQIYNLGTGSEHYSLLLFFGWTVVFLIAYFLESSENIIMGLVLFSVWSFFKYNFSDNVSGYIFLILGIGVLLQGLNIIHNSLKHKFSTIYRFWTVFYFLLLFFLISFQTTLQYLSQYYLNVKIFTPFLITFLTFCFFVFIFSNLFAFKRKDLKLKESLVFILILLILSSLIFLTKIGAEDVGQCRLKNFDEFKDLERPLERNEGCKTFEKNECADNCIWDKSYESDLPQNLWILWMINNILFIGFIIFILWHGQILNATNIINLAFIFFVLEVISRYIGFWIDFSGYFAFSLLAISGGVILLLASWLIPKWRKKVLSKVK